MTVVKYSMVFLGLPLRFLSKIKEKKGFFQQLNEIQKSLHARCVFKRNNKKGIFGESCQTREFSTQLTPTLDFFRTSLSILNLQM